MALAATTKNVQILFWFISSNENDKDDDDGDNYYK